MPSSKAVEKLIAETEAKFTNLKALTGAKKKTLSTENVQINKTVPHRAQSKVGLYSRTARWPHPRDIVDVSQLPTGQQCSRGKFKSSLCFMGFCDA